MTETYVKNLETIAVYNRPDGMLSILRVLETSKLPDESEEETIIRCAKMSLPAGADYFIISESDIPEDKFLRDAWHVTDEGVVKVNMEAGEETVLGIIRELRKHAFIKMGFPYKLDPELEAAVINEETRAKLQWLRDLPSSLDFTNVKTEEDLKRLVPAELLT